MCTRTIRIEFSVLVLPLFEAIRLAEEIATLDVLSGGRIDLGVSRGNTSRYFEAWGLDYADRSAAFDTVFDKLIATGQPKRSRSAHAQSRLNRNASSARIPRSVWPHTGRGCGVGRTASIGAVPG